MTREEAIGVLEDVRDAICENIPGSHPELDELKEAVQMAVNALEERKTWQWIPCSERLPEDSGWYIVTKNLAYDTTWVGLEWYNHENGWKYDDGKCIAWMPLPESYKGEQE